MNTKSIFLAAIAILAVGSVLAIGGIGSQIADAGSGPGCNHASNAAATPDPNAPNRVNTNTPVTSQPTI
jgi:hypothetical protein